MSALSSHELSEHFDDDVDTSNSGHEAQAVDENDNDLHIDNDDFRLRYGVFVKLPIQMPEDMLSWIIQTTKECVAQGQDFSSLSVTLKRRLDAKYSPHWHVVIGSDFGSLVTHESRNFLFFKFSINNINNNNNNNSSSSSSSSINNNNTNSNSNTNISPLTNNSTHANANANNTDNDIDDTDNITNNKNSNNNRNNNAKNRKNHDNNDNKTNFMFFKIG